ncbi:hypothetical protein BDW74DRAFT_174762 [Aspergillus multicolor]|uniref:uncharacterized protein n=1 Tax=Aspergillus multicolor TaxID=41759 RepID=UPI003CCCB117
MSSLGNKQKKSSSSSHSTTEMAGTGAHAAAAAVPAPPALFAIEDTDTQSHHSCFAAEIAAIQSIRNTKATLLVDDNAGNPYTVKLTLPSRIPIPDHGRGIDPKALLIRGLTILVAGAVERELPDGELRIEVGDWRCVKTLPFRLAHLTYLAVSYVEHTDVYGRRMRMCCCCGTLQRGMQHCPQCRVFYFCSPRCQDIADEEGHRYDCEVLRDTDMLAYFQDECEGLPGHRFQSMVMRAEPGLVVYSKEMVANFNREEWNEGEQEEEGEPDPEPQQPGIQ